MQRERLQILHLFKILGNFSLNNAFKYRHVFEDFLVRLQRYIFGVI